MPPFPLPYRNNDHAAHVLSAVRGGLRSYQRPLSPASTRVWENSLGTDLLILTVSGELDKATSPLLEQNLDRPLPAVTVLDLSRVTFLGVAGLRALEIAAARAVSERRRIGVVTAAAPVLRIFRLFALDVRVPVYPLLADAIRELTPKRPADSPGR
ncbi:STAS domain-containing protein [Amycolatopsis sp. cmx-4-54]|uniref:STAS domain-containing protein n=1 Tax=Amycolatopsis sp. cmx-4-54 TaxID=2790936 RepID=UPI00397D9107